MSSNSSDLMLNGPEYRSLTYKPKTINDWFEAWKEALGQRDFLRLLQLTHWGLQFLSDRQQSGSVIELFCHYLAVADGHGSPKNFGHDGSPGTAADFASMSHGELMQKLSDKAWMELCNRVFVFTEDGGGHGQRFKYDWYFRQPELAEAMLRFIDPDRWLKDGLFRVAQSNIDMLSKCAYQAKALAFAKTFLWQTWRFREIREREIQFYESEKQDSIRADPKFVEQMTFFRKLKPRLARLMVHYDMAEFLHDQKLDHPTRKMLETFVWGSKSASGMTLDEAYGHIDPKHGYLTLNHREVARILFLYPSLVRGRRNYVREQVRARRAAKALEQEKLRFRLKEIKDKLKDT
jgi:hypothetical protein